MNITDLCSQRYVLGLEDWIVVENRIIRTEGEPRRIVLTVQCAGEGAEDMPYLVVVQTDQYETGLGGGIGGGRGEGEKGRGRCVCVCVCVKEREGGGGAGGGVVYQ
jgi:hypothetical protein